MRITSDVAEFLKVYGKPKRYKAGDYVIREGEYSDTVFIVLDGTAEICKKGAAGTDTVIAETGRGAVFGEMGAFLNYKRSASVRAAADLTVIMFNSQSFIQALFKLPDLTIRVIKSFANRVQELNEKLLDISFSKLTIVVGVSIIEQFRNSDGQPDENGFVLVPFHPLKLKNSTKLEIPKIQGVLDKLKEEKIITNCVEGEDGILNIVVHIENLLAHINEKSYVEEA